MTDWRPGDDVCALLAGGGYAEQVAVPAGQVLPWPAPPGDFQPGSAVGAAALPEAACTVYANVFLHAQLQPGETLLVHGGASGIGTLAIQLAGRLGAASRVHRGVTAKACPLPRTWRRSDDLLPGARTSSTPCSNSPAGAALTSILDIMGAAYLGRNVTTLATGGRLVVIGLQGGARGELDLGQMMHKRVSVYAASLRARPVSEKAAIVAAVRENVWPLIRSGLGQTGHRHGPAADHAAEAHRLLDSKRSHRQDPAG